MTTVSFPPLSVLSVTSIQAYDDQLEQKEQAELAAGNVEKAHFDDDVIKENEALINAREHPNDPQAQEEFAAIQKAMYADEMRMLQADPTIGSDC